MCTFQSLSSFSHQDVWIPRERNGIAYEHPLACQTLFEFDQIFFVNYIHDIYINVWETETFKSQGNSASSKNCQGWAQASQSDFASSCSLRLAFTSSLMVFISAARSFKVLAMCSSPCMNNPPCLYDLADTPETPETPETPDTGAALVLWIPKREAEAATH